MDLRAPEDFGHFGRQGGKESAEATPNKLIEFPVHDFAEVRSTLAIRRLGWSVAPAVRRATRPGPAPAAFPKRSAYGAHILETMDHRTFIGSGGATSGIECALSWRRPEASGPSPPPGYVLV